MYVDFQGGPGPPAAFVPLEEFLGDGPLSCKIDSLSLSLPGGTPSSDSPPEARVGQGVENTDRKILPNLLCFEMQISESSRI